MHQRRTQSYVHTHGNQHVVGIESYLFLYGIYTNYTYTLNSRVYGVLTEVVIVRNWLAKSTARQHIVTCGQTHGKTIVFVYALI